MKSRLLGILVLLLAISNVNATDLIVEEYGAPSTYSSISAAITAATSGDRVIVKNRAGQLPWIEDLSINKSLTLMSGQEDSTFLLDGSITIVQAQNREVSIIGAHILNSKSITTSGSAIPVRSMEIKLYNCSGFNNSAVNIVLDVHATIVGCDFDHVNLKTGDLFGNKFTKLAIVNSSSSTTVLDTCYMIGNIIEGYNSNTQSFEYTTDDELLIMKNNKIRNSYSNNCIGMLTTINNSETHQIYNNTIDVNSSSYSNSMALKIYGTTTFEVVNNIIKGTSGYAIKDQGGYATINAFYNYLDGSVVGVENNLQQVASETTPDTGNPAVVFTDTDLTRNDIGYTGGPYPISNYFESNFELKLGSTTIFFVQHSIFISQSSAFNIKAFSYDK